MHSQVHAGLVRVCGAVVDKGRDELDHLVDELGGVRAVVRAQDVESFEDRLVVDRFPFGGNLGFGGSFPAGAIDDVVVDVGDVGDVVNLEAPPFEVPTHEVIRHGLTGVPEVRVVIDGGPTRVQRDLAFVALRERTDLTGERVVEADHGRTLSGLGFS